MPDITVSMPAYNVGKYIRRAIESVLSQEAIDLELIVVNDASTDGTEALVESVRDGRIRVLQNARRMGIGHCHNVVLRESRSRCIAHVDADDFLLPGALRKMVDALLSDPTVGQAHCHYLNVDEQGKITREAFYQRWESFRVGRPPTLDYRALLGSGKNVINHLRTYPTHVLEELGGFNEKIPFAVDYEMALRLLERYRVKLVPEFLYCRRIHFTNTTESLHLKSLRFWKQMYEIRKDLVREKKATFLQGSQFDLHHFVGRLVTDASYHLGVRRKKATRRVMSFIKWRLLARVGAPLYRRAANHLSWWPLGGSSAEKPAPKPQRIAYYLNAFPVSSETFIQREVEALRRSGVRLEVFANEKYGESLFDDNARRLMEQTRYLETSDYKAIARYSRTLAVRRPLQLLNTFLYLVFRTHNAYKSFKDDCELFQQAIHLAGVLKKRNVTHVHAPWASTDALVALLAARFLKIPYTVQARAYDLHRNTSQYGLKERLRHADFVVTNARFNEARIRSLLSEGRAKNVHVIYEGVELSRFQPAVHTPFQSVVRILTVARIVAPKGLEYLLQACKILKDRRYSLKCEIVGGTVASDMNYYISLMKLRRSLSLENEVTFRGARSFDYVLSRYAAADIFVLPAVIAEDGSGDVTPNAVIEAMAMKLPVISTRSRGIPELVEDGVSGLLAPSRDPEALAEAVIRLINDPALSERLGGNARKRVEEKFEVDRNMGQLVTLFGGRPGLPASQEGRPQ